MDVQNQLRPTTGAAAPPSLAAAGTSLRASDAGRGALSPAIGAVDQAQLAVQLRKVAGALKQLSLALSVSGGGAPAQMCAAHAKTTKKKGAKGAPSLERVLQRDPGSKPAKHDHARHADRGTSKGATASSSPKDASASPKQVPGEESHNGLGARSRRVLDAAHDSKLKLVSGHRPGDSGGHGNGSAVDVGNVKLGTATGSKEMQAFAEEMRQAGKSGDDNIGYVIYKQKIASARDNWAWRPMEDRGSNTENHLDHVHVSTDPKR